MAHSVLSVACKFRPNVPIIIITHILSSFCCAELAKVPPMFGNVQSLMNHLQMHRDRPPTGELLYRTRCIVGRIAGPEEDWDINLPARVEEIPD
jgi:hypothetical protein